MANQENIEQVLSEPILTLDSIIRRVAQQVPDKLLLSYPSPEDEYTDLSARQLEHITSATGLAYNTILKDVLGSPSPSYSRREIRNGVRSPAKEVVVGLVGPATLEYYLTFLALQRLGYTTILISTRLADEGFAHLLRAINCDAVVATPGVNLDAMHRVHDQFGVSLAVIPMLSMSAIRQREAQMANSEDLLVLEVNGPEDAPGLIMHTGGSTGLPKPVRSQSGRWLNNISRISHGSNGGLCTLPPFHSFGMGILLGAICFAEHLILMNASRPITAERVFAGLRNRPTKRLATVPYVLKFLTEVEGGVAELAKLELVRTGGSALPQAVGDVLAQGGVKFMLSYGQTENGILMCMSPEIAEEHGYSFKTEWNWMRPLLYGGKETHLRFERVDGYEDDVYQLICLPTLPSLHMHNRPDGSYATKDLFRRHPTDLNRWKFVARYDDIIVMVNGEKADPHPLEQEVMRHPNVRVAVVFGSGRDALGMIVVASERTVNMSTEEVLESILPNLEAGNLRTNAYARVGPDSVIIKEAGTPYPMTDKSTLIRPQFIKNFAQDIEAHYAAREQAAQNGVLMLTDPSKETIRMAIREIVEKELRVGDDEPMTDDTDFFSMGMDSLQAVNARTRLMKRVPLDDMTLATNVVFDNPSVNALTEHLMKVLSGGQGGAQSAEALALNLARKYSSFPSLEPGSVPQTGEVFVLLTGATGFIGKHILVSLLLDPQVVSVTCLTRADSDTAAHRRILSNLQDAHLFASLSSAQVAKLSALATDLSSPSLGLPANEYARLRTTTTHIIHNAWPVNFNMSLASFESSGIAPTHHLFRLAIASPLRPKPAFTFVSSVAAVMRASQRPIREQRYPISAAAPMGYGLSKWVAEDICAAAADTNQLSACRVIRVGQVCGDRVHGRWNEREAIPAMVQSAATTGALPMMDVGLDDEQYWLPVDVTGKAVAELALCAGDVTPNGSGALNGSDGCVAKECLDVFHVANSERLSWNKDVLPVLEKEGLKFESVAKQEWLRRLEASDKDVRRNRPRRLLEHFKTRYGGQGLLAKIQDEDSAVLDLKRSRAHAPSMASGVHVDGELVGKFFRYWRDEVWTKEL